ncbi:MAG: flagellar hook-associated protein FlgK [Gammaproteobacteria bacterium]|nr:flagellar hook-associated protein FlgK [Gammaproteobacteria bacterium]
MGDLLNIGASATELYRQALSTVSNNIANLNSDGYSRQEVRAVENTPQQQGVSYMGTGANSRGVFRSEDEFATANVRVATSKVSEQKPLVAYTDRLLDLLGSDEGALSNGINRFFTSAAQLSSNPAETAYRQEFLASSEFFVNRAQAMGAELESMDIEIQRAVKAEFDELNKLSKSLALVNRELAKTPLAGKQPPALLDQRDFLLLEMSQYASLDVAVDTSERVSVKLEGASKSTTFVDQTKSYNLDAKFPDVSGGAMAVIFDSYGQNLNTGGVKRGSIGGLLSFKNQIFEPLRDNLDILVTTVAKSINNLHKEGLTPTGKVGLEVFDLTPKYRALQADGTRANAIVATAPEGTADVNIRASWNAAKGQWRVQNLATEVSSDVSVTAGTKSNFVYNGLTVAVNKTLQDGEQFVIKPNLRSVDNISALLKSTKEIATADRLQIEGAMANAEKVDPSISYSQRADALSQFAQFDTSAVLDTAQTKTFQTNQAEPALFIPRNVEGFSITIQPPVDKDYALQLVTSEYNHIVGSDTLPASITGGAKQSIVAGTSLVNTYLNAQGAAGYKDTSITIGSLTGTSGREGSGVRRSSVIPIQTNSTAGTQTLIAANNVKLNGTNLGALTLPSSATLSARDIATWVNGITPTPNVTAVADSTRTYKWADMNATGGLTINGTTVIGGGIGAPATLSALATLINNQTGSTNVEAALMPNDRIQISNTDAHIGKNITLGGGGAGRNFLGETDGIKTGSVTYTSENTGTTAKNDGTVNFEFVDYGAGTGKAKDLSRIGLATTITSNTTLDDDFLLYVTGSVSAVDVRYDVQKKAVLPDVAIEPAFTLNFNPGNRNLVSITDTATSTVLATKAYTWPNGVLVNDVKVLFADPPAAGDVFTIKPNTGALGDNGTINRILAVKDTGVNGDQVPIQNYISLVSDIGNQNNLAKLSGEALQVVLDDAEAVLDNTVGVTLDSEAADLIRYQQSYQAAAQIIKTARDLFDTLIAASRS